MSRSWSAAVTGAGLVLLTAACGGSASTRVAHVGSTASASAASDQGGGAMAFSRCVRTHGVPAYPDPGSGGLLPKKTPQQLGVADSVLRAAQRACIHLVPNGGRPTPAQVQLQKSVMLKYARCIRAHGVPNMPDPDSRGHLDIGPGSGVDVNSPGFEAAYQVCKADLSP